MELKPLSEVDLREAIGPINRAVTGHYLPAVRTVSGLRERAQLGVLDLRLSRCAFLGGRLVGTCLIERVDERAHLDAIGVDPLAQQRGVGHAMLEAACCAAEAGGVAVLTAEISDSDAASMATLQSAGFVGGRELGRFELRGPPADLPVPEEVEEAAVRTPATRGQSFVRPVPLTEALETVQRARGAALAEAAFAHQPAVLERLRSRLSCYLLLHLEQDSPVLGAAVIERDRHVLVSLGGQVDRLAPLVVLLARRHGVVAMDSMPEGDPLGQVLRQAGFQRTAVRREMVRRLG